MTDNEIPTDPESLKAAVRERWTARSSAWERNADFIAELAGRLNEPLIDAADVRRGQHVLDLASGVGEPAMSLARRVGEGGRVTATDLVADMLDGAKRRVAAAGIVNVAFEIADMEALPFDGGHFDRVVCRFGIMFSPRVDAALGEARRVLKPGGRAAFMVWGPRADNTMFEVVQTIAPEFVAAPVLPEGVGQFRFGEAGSLAAEMRAAGFLDVEEIELRFTPSPPAGSRFWQSNLEMSLGTALDGAPAATLAALDKALDDAFAAHLDGDAYRLEAHARVATGVAPR